MKKYVLALGLFCAFTVLTGFDNYKKTRNGYGLVCIRNDTNYHLSYSIKWGNGEWRNFRIESGRNNYHSWEYSAPNNYSSPDLHIQFDASPNNGWQKKSYVLERYRASGIDCDQAKRYEFRLKPACPKCDSVADVDLFSLN